MRLILKTNSPTGCVPRNYIGAITGIFYRWLSVNPKEKSSPGNLHDNTSLYSVSPLLGGKLNEKKLWEFPNGADFFISSHDPDLIFRIVNSIKQNDELAYGMRIIKMQLIADNPKDFVSKSHFQVAGPVFIKRTVNNKDKFYYHTDKEAGELLTGTAKTKMRCAGLTEDPALDIQFDRQYRRAATQLIKYKDYNFIGSICPVIIRGRAETKQFLCNVGIGNNTAMGFGALHISK